MSLLIHFLLLLLLFLGVCVWFLFCDVVLVSILFLKSFCFLSVFPRPVTPTSYRPIHGTEKNIETKNPDSHKKARIRLKLSNKHSLSQQYECKTRKDTDYCITKYDQTKHKKTYTKNYF